MLTIIYGVVNTMCAAVYTINVLPRLALVVQAFQDSLISVFLLYIP